MDNTNTENSQEEKVSLVSLSQNYMQCPIQDLVILISRMITSVILINDGKLEQENTKKNKSKRKMENGCTIDGKDDNEENKTLTRFHSKIPPPISVYDYLVRLTKYSSLDHSVLLTTVYYIDLLTSVYPVFNVNSLTVHRFLLAATTVASKGLCDLFFTNNHYAKVGGVQYSELNILEEEFLNRINFRIIPRDYNLYLCKQEIMQQKFNIYPPKDQLSLANQGYNILTTYYTRMIQVVGNYNTCKDKSHKKSYTILLSPPIRQRYSLMTDTSENTNSSNNNSRKRAYHDHNHHHPGECCETSENEEFFSLSSISSVSQIYSTASTENNINQENIKHNNGDLTNNFSCTSDTYKGLYHPLKKPNSNPTSTGTSNNGVSLDISNDSDSDNNQYKISAETIAPTRLSVNTPFTSYTETRTNSINNNDTNSIS
ncbi:uncharacterized protein SCODWIG_03787 [Saccharomycodes ludwigii]|uniref:PHO85 cyclin PHO80 n=1 Tax=Saccharomycodes ludwigii TaxID=36035 RepID=A0A376BBF8_9ASCO|nr:uncharacterized protein SCODWIG_03787 [Saccharomycodes ludwigii]